MRPKCICRDISRIQRTGAREFSARIAAFCTDTKTPAAMDRFREEFCDAHASVQDPHCSAIAL